MKTQKTLLTLAKELGFKTEEDYFFYCMESYVNGNLTQCRDLFAAMKRDDQKTFLTFLKDLSAMHEIFTFYFDLY